MEVLDFEKETLLSVINHQPDIDKMYLYAKNPYEAKCQLLIEKRESASLKNLNDSKAFNEYSNDVDNIYKNIGEHSPNRKWKILIIFDDMIADMLSNKKLNLLVKKLFIRGRKLNIFLIFITQSSYFAVLKNVSLWKFQTSNNFGKSHLIIHQIFTLKTL